MQPLKISHSLLLTSAGGANSPSLNCAGPTDHWSNTFTLGRAAGWCGLFLLENGVCKVLTVFVRVYLSDWLLVEERDGKTIWRLRSLWGLSRHGRGTGWLWMMNGNHTSGLEFGKVEAKLVLHPGKGSSSQTIASNMVCIDGGKL